MSSETTNEQFRANMLAEIKNILTDLSQIKEMAAGATKRKPARKTAAKKKVVKRKPARKTAAKKKVVKRKPARRTSKTKRKTRRR